MVEIVASKKSPTRLMASWCIEAVIWRGICWVVICCVVLFEFVGRWRSARVLRSGGIWWNVLGVATLVRTSDLPSMADRAVAGLWLCVWRVGQGMEVWNALTWSVSCLQERDLGVFL